LEGDGIMATSFSILWKLGKNVFGRFGSGNGNLSVDRKVILREKLRTKKSRP
jgi:hypothetical protein